MKLGKVGFQRYRNQWEPEVFPINVLFSALYLMLQKWLQQLLPGSAQLQLTGYELNLEKQTLTLSTVSIQTSLCCPLCKMPTQRIHSHYQRTLSDLPCIQFSLIIVVEVCKFFCDNSNCPRRIFTARLPEIAAPWARKTIRLVQRLQAIGLALGGAAGASLAAKLGLVACGSTLLNQLNLLPIPEIKVPKILGVDDFAFRKGQQYGTILVDLERHRPIALLADRKAEAVAEWLLQHPGVEILARDRSKTYKRGMSQGAPKAIQVADRFHRVYNLSQALETFFRSYGKDLKAVETKQRQQIVLATEAAIIEAKPTATRVAQVEMPSSHYRRVQQQKEIKRLRQQHWPQAAIAQAVGVSIRTVQRFTALPDFPAILPSKRCSTFGRSILDPYKPMLLEWWNSGITQTNVLMGLLQQQGYTGTIRTLQRYISSLRQAQGLPPRRVLSTQLLPKVVDPQLPPLTARRAAYLLSKRVEKRDVKETELLTYLEKQHPDFAKAIELSKEFLEILRQRKVDLFDTWLAKALATPLKSLKKFAAGLKDDYEAVKASLMLPVSNGPVEGFNNRLKMLKRQMYGRAGLELLSKRLILC